MKLLEAEGELQRITTQVDAKHELGAICKVCNEKPNSPALLFENVKGSSIPVVGQLLATDRRVRLVAQTAGVTAVVFVAMFAVFVAMLVVLVAIFAVLVAMLLVLVVTEFCRLVMSVVFEPIFCATE